MKYLFVLLLIIPLEVRAGPVWPTRSFLVQPTWDGHADTTSLFGHGGYWAQVQRGFGSDSARWAWDITMGAIFEFARWNGDKSLFGFSGMELTADLNDAIDFRPRGAFWHEGLVYAAKESSDFEWQVGTIYTCRHDIDNGDPGQYSDVFGERTLIYGSLSGKAIWTSDRLLGLAVPTVAWLHGDLYYLGEDYRLPRSDEHLGTDFQAIEWSFGEAFQSKLANWNASSLYLMVFTDFTAFGRDTNFFGRFSHIAKVTFDGHAELGFEFHGVAGRMQVYAGWEHWEDDGAVPIPRNAQFLLAGIRITGTDLIRF